MRSCSRMAAAVGIAAAALLAAAACGGPAERASEPRFLNFGAVWSPDGRWIAFQSAPLGRASDFFGGFSLADYSSTAIWVVNAAGGKPRKVADGRFAAWSADSRRILFTGRRGVAVVSSDGTRLKNMTHRQSFQPSWSPDGSRLAWVQVREAGTDENEVWAANADGTHARRLSRSRVKPFDPAWSFDTLYSWSPNGHELAFAVARAGKRQRADTGYGGSCAELHVVGAEGTGERRISRWAVEFAWSPSGRRIAFVTCDANRDEWPYERRLYVASLADRKRPEVVASASASEPGSALSGVSWTPDARALVFTRSAEGGGTWLDVVTPSGRRLASVRGNTARWSPDARKLAFHCRPAGICTMNRDGSGRKRVTGPPVSNALQAAPAWTSDGERLAFVSRGAIYVVNADGSGLRRVASTP